MNEHSPEQSFTPKSSETAATVPSLAQIEQDHHKRQAQVQERFGAEMSKEEACKEIGEALLIKATDGGEGEKYLSEFLEHDAFPDQINETLWQAECDMRARRPDFSIIDQINKSPRRIVRMLSSKIKTEQKENENLGAVAKDGIKIDEEVKKTTVDAVKKEEKTEEKEEENDYQAILNSPEYKNASNIAKVRMMSSHPSVPDSEKAKWRQFAQIISISEAVPKDSQIITTRLNTMDFSKGVPSAKSFATWAIFDNPNSQVKSGVSEATQDAIAQSLGIARNNPKITTGSDAKEAFENGSTETYIDENGEEKTRTIPLQPGEEVEFREGQYLGYDDAGNKTIRVQTTAGSFKTNLPDNPTDEDMTQIVSSVQMISAFHNLNLAELMYERPITERGGGQIDLRFPGDFVRTKRLAQILFSGTAGYDGEIIAQPDIDKIPYLMQFHSSKGDAMRGDVDPDWMRRDLQTQGVMKDGSIDWDRFEEMVSANRQNMYRAAENFVDTAE